MVLQSKMRDIHGWMIIDKPLGIASSSVVSRVKKKLNARKVGHGGTLDPLATGLLPIALGEATKTVSYIMDGRKTYVFSVKWGTSTSTDDAEGQVIKTCVRVPTSLEIENVIPNFVGEIQQVPPQFSAVRVNGKRAYQLARQNRLINLLPRPVNVHSLSFLENIKFDESLFKVQSGKGFYVRSLARDLGEALGTFAHVKTLRRTSVGPFFENESISLDSLDVLGHSAIESKHFFGIESVLNEIPALNLNASDALRLKQGQVLPAALALGCSYGPITGHLDVVAAMAEGKVVAIAKVKDGEIMPRRVFNN